MTKRRTLATLGMIALCAVGGAAVADPIAADPLAADPIAHPATGFDIEPDWARRAETTPDGARDAEDGGESLAPLAAPVERTPHDPRIALKFDSGVGQESFRLTIRGVGDLVDELR